MIGIAGVAGSASGAEEGIATALARIDALNGRLGAFVEVLPERALAAARTLDERVRLGIPKGPLHGVPVGVKDVIDLAGVPTRGGSLTRAGEPPALRSAPVVEMLEAAGAVVVGKTATVEYAFGGWGTNETCGTPLNPWDMDTPRTPGGSSSGSGVAVAAGLVPLALGTDTGGSVRLPASFCGTVGLKTTVGLVDKSGAMTLSSLLDSIGPLTVTVADAALALSVLADPGRIAGGDLARIAAGEVPDLAGRRIGVCSDLGVSLHPATRRTYETVIGALEDAGAEIVWLDLGRPLAAFAGRCGHYLAVESYMNFSRFVEEQPNRLNAAVRERMLDGAKLSAPEFFATMEDRAGCIRTVAAAFERVDAILSPTTAEPAPTLADHVENQTPAVFTRFANYVDLAALSIPAGLSDEGLPVSMQINVPGFHEARALALGAALEQIVGGPIRCPVAV